MPEKIQSFPNTGHKIPVDAFTKELREKPHKNFDEAEIQSVMLLNSCKKATMD
ncbi:hypothetical protein [Paenibacillus chibensis]|uniref:hypothetical protein n=1 Tax=Paenibacillus chibensis TaxID=59846 RepID=UPI002DB94554|nr:hypothetical protein [Paenibacillus chibensis]MEC0368996.1 hypothetical protein [Paenibacillus chibensis]